MGTARVIPALLVGFALSTASYAATSEGSSAAAVRLTGSGASESAFKTQAVGRRVLHLATHGFFLGGQCAPVGGPEQGSGTGTSSRIARENPLLMSGLVLAGANQRSLAPDQPDQEDRREQHQADQVEQPPIAYTDPRDPATRRSRETRRSRTDRRR